MSSLFACSTRACLDALLKVHTGRSSMRRDDLISGGTHLCCGRAASTTSPTGWCSTVTWWAWRLGPPCSRRRATRPTMQAGSHSRSTYVGRKCAASLRKGGWWGWRRGSGRMLLCVLDAAGAQLCWRSGSVRVACGSACKSLQTCTCKTLGRDLGSHKSTRSRSQQSVLGSHRRYRTHP